MDYASGCLDESEVKIPIPSLPACHESLSLTECFHSNSVLLLYDMNVNSVDLYFCDKMRKN